MAGGPRRPLMEFEIMAALAAGIPPATARPLHVIAREIRDDWKPKRPLDINHPAGAYLGPMGSLDKIGDQYGRTRLTPFVQSVFHKWLSWTR